MIVLPRWLRTAVAVLLAWFGFTNAALAEPFVDPNERYSVSFPEGWTVTPDPNFPGLMAAVPPRPRSVENIKIVSADMPPGHTLERYVSASLAAYKKIWTVREQGDVTLPAGPARRVVLDQDLTAMNPQLAKSGQAKSRVLKVFLTSGEHVFVVTCSSTPVAFAKSLPTFESVVRSLKILPPPAPGAMRRLEAPAFALSYPATWQGSTGQLGMDAILFRRVGQDKASIMVQHDPANSAPDMVEASRRNHADGKLGAIIGESQVVLGDRPAHRRAFTDPDEL
jgi:hypothetical protein